MTLAPVSTPLNASPRGASPRRRVGRHGTLMTSSGRLNIRSAKFASDYGPIDPEVPTVDCSRAYLHHLIRMKEPLATTLASMHNVMYMNSLMGLLRQRILADEL